MKAETLWFGSTCILYDAHSLPAIGPDWLQPAFWTQRNAVLAGLGGRGSALAVQTELGPAVLKRYHRGGLIARWNRDRYVYLGAGRSRALAEWRLLAKLGTLGLPVPRPLTASCERAGACYRAGLLTLAIPGAEQLADIAGTLAPADWDALIELIDRFAAAGVAHPDLNARNILRAVDGRWHLIDFDRAGLSPRPRSARPMRRRLARSLRRLQLPLPKGLAE